jgi:hypothetical protein
MFANHCEEDEIYPLTTIETAEAQQRDQRFTTSKMPKQQKGIFVYTLLKTQKCYLKIINKLSQHLFSTGLLVGITITSSTLGTLDLKRQ